VIGAIVQQPAVQQAASTMWTWTQGTGSAVWTAISGVASSVKKISYNFVAWTPRFIRMLYKNTENYFELNKKLLEEKEVLANKILADCNANVGDYKRYYKSSLLESQNVKFVLKYCLTNITETKEQNERDVASMKLAGQERESANAYLSICHSELKDMQAKREHYEHQNKYHKEEARKFDKMWSNEIVKSNKRHDHDNAMFAYATYQYDQMRIFKNKKILHLTKGYKFRTNFLQSRNKHNELYWKSVFYNTNNTCYDTIFQKKKEADNCKSELLGLKTQVRSIILGHSSSELFASDYYADQLQKYNNTVEELCKDNEELTAKFLNTTERLNISLSALEVVILELEIYRIKNVLNDFAFNVVCVELVAVGAAGLYGLYYAGMAAYAAGMVYYSTTLP